MTSGPRDSCATYSERFPYGTSGGNRLTRVPLNRESVLNVFQVLDDRQRGRSSRRSWWRPWPRRVRLRSFLPFNRFTSPTRRRWRPLVPVCSTPPRTERLLSPSIRRTAVLNSASWKLYYFAPIGAQSIVVSMSVCLFVCLSECSNISKTTCPDFTQMFCTCYMSPWLSPPLTAVQCVIYFRFCGWIYVVA